MQVLSVPAKSRILDFTFKWVFMTLLGVLFSLLIVEINEKPDMNIVEAAMGSLAISLPQSYLLRKIISPVIWVLSTVFAWVVISLIGVGVLGWTVTTSDFLPTRIIASLIAGSIGGLLIGISQWWLAIPPSFSGAWKWIFVNIMIWIVAVPVGSIVGLFLHRMTNVFLAEVAGLAVTWLLVSILTGMSIVRIIKDL